MTPTHRLSDRVGWLVGRASLRAQRLIADRFVGGDLRKQHYGSLASRADRGPATQALLADRLGLDRSDLVSLLDDLEVRGYVVRRPMCAASAADAAAAPAVGAGNDGGAGPA